MTALRLNYRQWLARIAEPFFRARREPKPEKKADKAVKRTWSVLGRTYGAYTKSEARGMAKKDVGTIPPGTRVALVAE